MIRIVAWGGTIMVLAISIGFLVPEAAVQSVRDMKISQTSGVAKRLIESG